MVSAFQAEMGRASAGAYKSGVPIHWWRKAWRRHRLYSPWKTSSLIPGSKRFITSSVREKPQASRTREPRVESLRAALCGLAFPRGCALGFRRGRAVPSPKEEQSGRSLGDFYFTRKQKCADEPGSCTLNPNYPEPQRPSAANLASAPGALRTRG